MTNSRSNPSYSRISLPATLATIGTKSAVIKADGESPLRKQKLTAYSIDDTSVSNQRFAEFVEDTGYTTDAEKTGWSYVFVKHLPESVQAGDTLGVASANWWRQVHGASWKLINGPESKDAWHADHPVVHVSQNDARAFAAWAGGRLPTEAEWENAARGGLSDVKFPWGDQEPDDNDFQPCNIWQGTFPNHNSAKDGYRATAPVRSYEPNGFGLYNLVGNVWEWTSVPYSVRALHSKARKHKARMKGAVILKGGSFLCHKSYCYRYRIAARSGNTPDSTAAHTGFRVVYDD